MSYQIRPPRCPDCNRPMNYVVDDCTGQGGPPADTWLCAAPAGCGRAQGSYSPDQPGIFLSHENRQPFA